MTTGFTEDSIGKRIASCRRARGYRTARDLADALEGKVSEAAIQNIESGRKSDLSVSQLLNISWAIRVSPLQLLVPLGSPANNVDLPNLATALERKSVAEFDEWVSMHPYGRTTWVTPDGYLDGLRVDLIRRLSAAVNAREETALELRNLRSVTELFPDKAEPEREEALDELWARQRAEVDAMADRLEADLELNADWARL